LTACEPSTPISVKGDWDAVFRLKISDLRHAEAKFVLYSNVTRLSLGSFALIALSILWVGWLALNGYFAIGWTSAMFFSAAGYLSMVHSFKTGLRQRMEATGLVADAICQVRVAETQFTLNTPNGQFSWPIKKVKIWRTLRGLLFAPEPDLYVFVSKHSEFPFETFEELRERAFAIVADPTDHTT